MERIRVKPVTHDVGAATVELENLAVRYNGRTVLRDVSLRVEPGQSIAVVGPNGAGKSTLFKVIAGVLEPTSGQVHIYGHGPHSHICIAYIPQRSEIDWSFPATAADVVMMGRVGQIGLFHRPSRADWDLVHQSLAQVGMERLARQQIGELSGGQQQRVFLARALAQEAELLLLDEPFTGLDAPTHEAILDILSDMRARNVTVLTATHDLNVAAGHFDRVMLLNRRVIAFGTPAEVLVPQTLVRAYGDHMHLLATEDGGVLLADTCCGGGEDDR
jgi:manganese/iron transport system ATP-binding protein